MQFLMVSFYKSAFFDFFSKKFGEGNFFIVSLHQIWKRIAHVSVTFGVRTRCVPSSKDV